MLANSQNANAFLEFVSEKNMHWQTLASKNQSFLLNFTTLLVYNLNFASGLKS